MEFLDLFTHDLLFWQILVVVFGSIVIKKSSFPKLHHVEMNQKSIKFYLFFQIYSYFYGFQS